MSESGEQTVYAPEWLALREPADAAARSDELVGLLRDRLAGDAGRTGPAVVRDLGCGTGSMGRWLAGRLPGPQHWIMHDTDPLLLARAGATMAGTAADGAPVSVTTERIDVTALTADVLAGTSLVTASALLDVLTAAEVGALAAACV
ncbi:SAM-dependent methyltransferase, partial [Micromonospora zhanjiangensis]